jgi:hypothetical protein
MKKTIVLSIVMLMLAVSIMPASAAQTPNYPSELSYIDAQINVMLPMLSQFQSVYYSVNGRYYQALDSHSSPPIVPVVPDGITASPTDQEESLVYLWNFASLPDTLAWSFSVSTYSGPDGDGYVLRVETVVNGETWTRAVNYGPDTWRGNDWYQVIPFSF